MTNNEQQVIPMGSNVKRIGVEAYSGYKANERPLFLIVDGRRIEVSEILDRWYGEEHDYFKISAEGRAYLLKWHRKQDVWSLLGGEERSETFSDT